MDEKLSSQRWARSPTPHAACSAGPQLHVLLNLMGRVKPRICRPWSCPSASPLNCSSLGLWTVGRTSPASSCAAFHLGPGTSSVSEGQSQNFILSLSLCSLWAHPLLELRLGSSPASSCKLHLSCPAQPGKACYKTKLRSPYIPAKSRGLVPSHNLPNKKRLPFQHSITEPLSAQSLVPTVPLYIARAHTPAGRLAGTWDTPNPAWPRVSIRVHYFLSLERPS